jgi:hypothetical protein
VHISASYTTLTPASESDLDLQQSSPSRLRPVKLDSEFQRAVRAAQAIKRASIKRYKDDIPRTTRFGPYRVAMMIAAKNGTMTTTTGAMATSQKARGPDNFVTADQTFCLKISILRI